MDARQGRIWAGLILAASVVIGLGWWVLVWQKGTQKPLPSALAPFLLAFGAVQLAGWLLMAPLWRTFSMSPQGSSAALLALCSLLVLGNSLFYFTPVLGAPLIAAATVAEAGLVFRRRAAGIR